MAFTEGNRGVYSPIKEIFDTSAYERPLQYCWYLGSYKCYIALIAELLRLQQNNQLSCNVSVEDMIELLMEESKKSLRIQMWEFEMHGFHQTHDRPLVQLMWEVMNHMKNADVEFEARRLLHSSEPMPPNFQHPMIISQAKEYATRLTEQQLEPLSSKLLAPWEVVVDVVPKVLQGFWVHSPTTSEPQETT